MSGRFVDVTTSPERDRLSDGIDLAANDLLARRDDPGASRPGTVLKPGQIGEPVTLGAEMVTRFLRKALGAEGRQVVWTKGDDEVLVRLDRTRFGVREGVAVFALTLRSDQTGDQELNVPFAVGGTRRETGLIATAPRHPHGHPGLADLWGDSVIALAWRLLLDVADAVATRSGADIAGRPLRPASIRATEEGLTVIPQAAHDLRRRG